MSCYLPLLASVAVQRETCARFWTFFVKLHQACVCSLLTYLVINLPGDSRKTEHVLVPP